MKPPKPLVHPSKLVLWSAWVGLFYHDFLIVTTHRLISKHGSAWTILRVREIDTVDVSNGQLSITAKGITHSVDFRKGEVAAEVADIIVQDILRQ